MTSLFALVEKLAPHLQRELDLVLKSEQEAESLSSKLNKIQVGLEGAEREEVTDPTIRDLLKRIEDAAYEMTDVLDEWEMQNLRVQLEGSEEHPSGSWEKVRTFAIYLCLCSKLVRDRREITKKIKALSDRIDTIVNERNWYTFASPTTNHSQEFRQPESTSDVPRPTVHGRRSDVEDLVNRLVPEGNHDSGTEIVSIIGVPGVGKTTLAQVVYNDPGVKGNFVQAKAWVSVPNPFEPLAVGKRILEAFGETAQHIQTLEILVTKIKEVVKEKKFLLVLDNVWTEDYSKWEPLKKSLHGASGSRILVTTRSELAARMMGATQQQVLGLLSNQDCEAILDEIAFHGKSEEDRQKMKPIGLEIAKKCNGLPLAARNVGSMLALRFTEQQWRNVMNNPLWRHEDGVGDLYRLLKLSYTDLSPLLKRCFLSCIAVPKGSLITVDEVIRIWMAYGYLSSRDSINDLQSKGFTCFQTLAMRSFFQKLESRENNEGETQFKVLDTMYDFAIYLSKSGHNYIMDGGFEKKKSLLFQRAQDRMPQSSLKKIRTFCASYISPEDLPLSHLERVRVLRMNGCNLQGLPQDVGKLIHLRYLNLSSNPIQVLPNTVSDLYNLQTLALENCSRLCRLPEGICKLKQLRHLLNSGTQDLKQFPQGFEELSGLWTLSEFRASGLEILRNLNELQGTLCIFVPKLNNNGADYNLCEEVSKANLSEKIYLRKLELYFDGDDQGVDAVNALQRPSNMEITPKIYGM